MKQMVGEKWFHLHYYILVLNEYILNGTMIVQVFRETERNQLSRREGSV